MDSSVKQLYKALRFSITLLVIIWAVHIYKYTSQLSLAQWGVYPREIDGLIGVLTSPLIHGSWEHLFSNSVPLFVSSTMIHFFYKRVAWPSFILIYLLTGAAVWMFGRSVYHIGASGVVYGLIAFIFGSGIFRRNIKSIILALVVTILYSGYLSGVLPIQEGVSWESHLMGAIMGMGVAWLMKGIIEKDEENYDPWEGDDDEPKEHFLPRDAFDMTRAERAEQLRRDQDDFLSI